jgi:hypothetical protein
MNNPQLPIKAIRTVLFRKAETLNERVYLRLAQVAAHLQQGEHRAAIGALEGVDADIAQIRALMLLMRDCFASDAPEKGYTQ